MRLILPLVLATLMISCFEQGDCADYSTNVLYFNFYNYSDKKTKTVVMDSILMEGLDSVMYENKSVTAVGLPLDLTKTSAKFHFYYENSHEVLNVTYHIRTFALAPDCNVIDLITLEEVTGSLVQDLIISQPDLTTNATENIKLYF